MTTKKKAGNKSRKYINLSFKVSLFVTIFGCLFVGFLFILDYNPTCFEPIIISINDFLGRLGL